MTEPSTNYLVAAGVIGYFAWGAWQRHKQEESDRKELERLREIERLRMEQQ